MEFKALGAVQETNNFNPEASIYSMSASSIGAAALRRRSVPIHSNIDEYIPLCKIKHTTSVGPRHTNSEHKHTCKKKHQRMLK